MRLFSAPQKRAVELVQDRTGEADHINPFSKGGETKVENCQMLTKESNIKKSAFQFKPRKWQSEFLKSWDERKQHQPYMLIAIPGGGKTMGALEAARRWMAAGSDRRIIVVVPTDNLREQWRDEASKFGIALQSKEFGTNFKHGFQGGVVTYHLVANQSLVFRKLCSVAPTMVIFDEIHHCGEDAHFGQGVSEAFELSKERLLMSGTPWKSDGKSIPFVKYDGNGYAVGDFSYDYPRALNEDVVRYLVFDHAKGGIRNAVTGDVERISQDISDTDASYRLKKILDPNGDYVKKQIIEAHRKLVECRKTIPDAGALAACIDQNHASQVANIIEECTGCKPSIIVSDSDIENDSVKQFRKSSTEWIVAVKKVSEGTDIKRLQVLCYLTNTTSELFFRQLVGRVSRVRDMEDYEAYVYLPADPRLIRCAQNIENAQVQALKEQSEVESRELTEKGESACMFQEYSTIHDGTDLILIGNERVSPEHARHVEKIAEAVGLSMQKVMQVMELSAERPIQVEANDSPVDAMSKEERMDSLRSKCSKVAFRLSKLIDVHVRQVHGRFKRQELMSEDELLAKYKQLIKDCNNA